MSLTAEIGFASAIQPRANALRLALADTMGSPRVEAPKHGRTASQARRISRLQNMRPAPPLDSGEPREYSRDSTSLDPRESTPTPTRAPAPPLDSRESTPPPPHSSAFMPQAAGIFASIEQSESEDWMEIHSVLRGGQLIKKVEPGDILLSIDHVSTKGLSISQVQELVAGREGSEIQLGVLRPRGDSDEVSQSTLESASGQHVGGSEIHVTIQRTRTELSDIDVATLKDVHEMIADRKLCQKHKDKTWRTPGSMEARLWEELCDALQIRNLHEEKDKRIAELERQLASAWSEGRTLRKELDDALAECEDLRRQLASSLEDGHGIGLGLGLDVRINGAGDKKFVVAEIVHGFGADACGHFQQDDVVCSDRVLDMFHLCCVMIVFERCWYATGF